MSFDFYDVILDPEYAPDAEGGPEFGNKLFTSPDNGLDAVSIGRAKARHRYTIAYQLLLPDSRVSLRNFFYAIGGIKAGFRFLAPDDSSLDYELIGTGTGALTSFSIIKTYSVTPLAEYGGSTLSYVRSIVKPAIGEMAVFVNDVELNLVTGTPGAGQAKINYSTGAITFGTAPANGHEINVSGRFHVPVRFGGDYFNPRYDISADISGIELMELMPANLGIT